jgi:hypothetical protein
MGLLDKFDLAYLFDSEWTDDAGLRRTKDRSRHGIHALVGDGSAAATMPTWDAARGLYTSTLAGQYLRLPIADDVNTVVRNIGSEQPETYCFYMDPLLIGTLHDFLNRVVADQWIMIRVDSAGIIVFRFRETGVGYEQTVTGPGVLSPYHGRSVLLTFTRDVRQHHIYVDDTLLVSSTPAGPYNASADANVSVLASPASGEGGRFFGYARDFVATPTFLRQLSRNLRGVL